MDTSTEFSEETPDSRDEGALRFGNNTEDHLRAAKDQLEELQLLTRADLHSSISSFTIPQDSSMDVEVHTRPESVAGGLSSFAAILNASRNSATAAAIVPLNSNFKSLVVETCGRCPSSNGEILPTLTEGSEKEEEDDENEETFTRNSLSTPLTLAEKLLGSHTADVLPRRQEQEPPDDLGMEDDEFVEMMKHISQGKIEVLKLTPEDITERKLERVQTALRSQSSCSEMPYVRALVSVDMLRLLLRRLGVETVRDAVQRVIRRIGEREETDSLLSSRNIAAVVLEVRREFTVSSNEFPQRTTEAETRSNRYGRRASSTTRSSSLPSSSLRSSAVDRRSILAKEGIHVLMQEKVMLFNHRGHANQLPAFRVRGASASITDSATKRRQRGLQYANDHVTHRTVHM